MALVTIYTKYDLIFASNITVKLPKISLVYYSCCILHVNPCIIPCINCVIHPYS